MSVALFVPCYIDQLYPDVAVATLELLERFGVDVVYPAGQTCCGQPMANTGCTTDAAPVARRLVKLFADYDQIVCPSGSCTSMVRNHYADYFEPTDPQFIQVRNNTFELCEYLTDVLKITSLGVRFPHRVSVHQSCHGLRELRLGPSSETRHVVRDKMRELLDLVDGVQWVKASRPDECCGFGGTFAVNEADVSASMGRDRIADHVSAGSDVIVAGDMSCLMHLQGIIRSTTNANFRNAHLATTHGTPAHRRKAIVGSSLTGLPIMTSQLTLPTINASGHSRNGVLPTHDGDSVHEQNSSSKHQDHPAMARDFVSNVQRTKWHDGALWFVRNKRDAQASQIPEWEYLREMASKIKNHSIANLPTYLEEFEHNATKLGAVVHWAIDAEEHNRIVCDLLRERGVVRVIKSKSMLTEECHLNPYLESHGIEVIDTDLGERIVQLRGERPSHIVLPAIHIKKEEVGDTFHEHLGTVAGAADPKYLAEAARGHLRQKFIRGEAGITGVNFAIAETGGFVVCTNEGNADLGASLPPIHIACMGLEKIIPKFEDLGVFIRLLARSATGQPITTYTSHFNGPRDSQSELHIVIVDNGRSELRDNPTFRAALGCIRCGACMNTCPVYRRSGGHSYNATVPGPIGSVLNPAMDDKKHKSLPYACSLCGSCSDVCPVRIPLHHQLLAWRKEFGKRGLLGFDKTIPMKAASWLFQHPLIYRSVGSWGRRALRILPRFLVINRFNAWSRDREMPPAPKESFSAWYAKHRGAKHDQ